jgi:hypothetical protein
MGLGGGDRRELSERHERSTRRGRRGGGGARLSRSGAVGSRVYEVHQLGALSAVDPSVVALHYPLVLLVSTGCDRGAVAGVSVSAFAVLTHNGTHEEHKPDKGCRSKNPPDELHNHRDEQEQTEQRAERTTRVRPRPTPGSHHAANDTQADRQHRDGCDGPPRRLVANQAKAEAPVISRVASPDTFGADSPGRVDPWTDHDARGRQCRAAMPVSFHPSHKIVEAISSGLPPGRPGSG